ncbi:hypothetical protein TWF569_005104 [Orbilia oligospora]|nr:hypothetical protein TWF569_005104 [Orbilia oligospora]
MRLPAAIVLLLLYTTSGVVGQPQIINPGAEPDSTTSLTTTEITTTTTTTTTTSSSTETTTATTSEITSSQTTTESGSSESTSSSISTTDTSSSTETSTNTTTTAEESSTTTSETTTSETTTSETTSSPGTSESSSSSTETETSTTETISSTESSTTTTTTEPTSTSETSITTETTSTTASGTSTTESESEPSTTTTESSTTSEESTSSSTTTTPESSTSESATSESTTSESTTSESTTESTSTETTTSTTESTTETTTTSESASTETRTSTTESTTTEATTTDTTTTEPTSTDSTTESSSTIESSTSETTSDTSTSETTSDTSSITTSTTSEETTTTDSTTTETDTATTTSDSTTTDTTTSESTSTTSSSTTQGTVTEYVFPTNGCSVPGARCHFYSMELNPTVYFVTTITVDDSTSTNAPNATFQTVLGFSTENPDITTIQPNNTILSNTGNIIPSSLATASNTDDITLVLPTTYQFIFGYNLPLGSTPTNDDTATDSVPTATDDVGLPTTSADVCPENTVLVTIPAYSEFTLSVFKGCTQYQAFLNFTRTLAITTKTAVVIETKGKDSIDGFGAPVTKPKDNQNAVPPNSKTQEGATRIPNSGDPNRTQGLGPGRTSNPGEDRPKSQGNPNPNPNEQPTRGPNRGPNEDNNTQSPGPGPGPGPTRGPNEENTRSPDSPNQTSPGGPNEQPTRGPGPTPLPNPNPNPNTTGGSGRPVSRTFNPDDFTLLLMPTPSRPAPGQTVTPGPNPTETRPRDDGPFIIPAPRVTTISGTETTTTSFVGVTRVPMTTVVRMPGGGSSTLTLFIESTIPITSFQPRVSAEPVVTTINGQTTTFLTVLSVSARPTVVPVTTTINGRQTVLSSTFFLPVTVPVPQFTPFLTTTVGPTIINGLPTFGPMVVTLAPLTSTTLLTDIVSGRTVLRTTTFILPATSTLPNPRIQTLKISTVIDGITTTVNFPISLSAFLTTTVGTTTVDGTRSVFTSTFFVPQGVPILNLPSVILQTTTINGDETTLSEFYTIRPVSVTTTINGRETVVLVPSVVPITTPRTFFSTSFLRTTINGRPTSIPEVYFLKPTTTTTVIEGRTSIIQTTTAVLVTTASLPEITSTRIPGFNTTIPRNTTLSNSTISAAPKITATMSIPLPPAPSQTGAASSIGLGSLLTCLGAFISAMLMTFI